MKSSHAILALAALTALAGCASMGQAGQRLSGSQVAGTSCDTLGDAAPQVSQLLSADNVRRVEPAYETMDHFGGAIRLHVSGARFYVPAEPGMSAPYLERALSCHAAAGTVAAAHPNDPLRVEGVKDVAVAAAGQGFRVVVTGVDRKSGEAIWQRARALRDGDVRVEQLAATSTQSSAL